MKRNIIRLLSFVFALLTLFCGCAAKNDAPTTEAPQTEDPFAPYLARITALEAELSKLREEKYITEKKYEAKIEELEKKLTQPDAVDASAKPDEGAIFRYTLKEGKATVTHYEGTAPFVNIPATLDGYPVVAIGERAFEGATVSAVTLPAGITSIGWFAFYGCQNLADITIPESVSAIGYAVFDGCPNVTFICPAHSYAEAFANSYGIPCVNG